ncbi:MAG: acyltransferase [Burkholderiaceae bacterium]
MQTSTPASPQPLERAADAPRAVRANARAEWVDVAKGMGIVLVVLGHAIGGLVSARLVAPDSAWNATFYLIYTFHMPLFFLLAGLFVEQRLASDAGGFVRSAFTRIAWPYLLWSVVQLLVIDAVGSAVNVPTEVSAWRLVALLWEPASQFWFLQALLVLHLASRLLLPHIGAAAFVLVLLLARGVVEWVELPPLLAAPARYGMYYALGVWLGPLLLRSVEALPRSRATALAAAATVVWAIAAVAAYASGHAYISLATLPAAFAGSAAVVALASLPRATLAAFWVQLGQASMAIYLLHVLFVAGTRIVLVKLLGLDAPAVILPLACVAGIAGPLLVRMLASRAGATRMLGLG